MLHLLPLLSTATSTSSRTAQDSARGKICQGRAQSQLGIKERSGLCLQILARRSIGPVPEDATCDGGASPVSSPKEHPPR